MSRRRVGSIRRVREGVYRVELTHGVDPWSGKRAYSSENVYGTERDAEIILARMVVAIGERPEAKNVTVGEFVEKVYLPNLTVRRETKNGYRVKLDNHVLPRYRHTRLNALDVFDLKAWKAGLLEQMSERSALNVYRVFFTALERSVDWGFSAANPLRGVDAPIPPERPVATLSGSEFMSYVDAFRGHELAPAVVLAVSTGFRPCEVAAACWEDIDFHQREVTCHRGLHEAKSETWFEPTKTARSNRTVPLSDWAINLLRPLRGIGPLVPVNGGHMKPSELQRKYRRQLKASGLRYVPMRDLRHTYGTLMIEAGVPLAVVSRMMGHSTTAITDKFYVRPHKEAQRAAVDALDAFLGATEGDKSNERQQATT